MDKKLKYEPTKTVVHRTKDYSIFSQIKGNRPINARNIFHITKSMLRRNMLDKIPAVVNEKFEVVDGQHRLEWATQNDEWFYFVVIDGARLPEVHLLNANSRTWKIKDYLDSYVSLGLPSYAVLKDFVVEHNFPISSAAQMLSGGTGRKRIYVLDAFRAGEFEVLDKKYAESVAGFIEEVRKYAAPDVVRERGFMYALEKIHNSETVTPEAFLAVLKRDKPTIERQGGLKHYLRHFEDLFSKGKRNLIRI